MSYHVGFNRYCEAKLVTDRTDREWGWNPLGILPTAETEKETLDLAIAAAEPVIAFTYSRLPMLLQQLADGVINQPTLDGQMLRLSEEIRARNSMMTLRHVMFRMKA